MYWSLLTINVRCLARLRLDDVMHYGPGAFVAAKNLRGRNMSGVGSRMKHLGTLLLAVVAASILAACGGEDVKETRSGAAGDRNRRDMSVGLGGKNTETGSLFGPGGLFGSKADRKDPQSGVGVAVNAYLWRASLDTINFIPLVSADPFGGVIIT